MITRPLRTEQNRASIRFSAVVTYCDPKRIHASYTRCCSLSLFLFCLWSGHSTRLDYNFFASLAAFSSERHEIAQKIHLKTKQRNEKKEFEQRLSTRANETSRHNQIILVVYNNGLAVHTHHLYTRYTSALREHTHRAIYEYYIQCCAST